LARRVLLRYRLLFPLNYFAVVSRTLIHVSSGIQTLGPSVPAAKITATVPTAFGVKGEVVPLHAMEALGGEEVWLLLFNFGTRRA
jgi:hypothetical protein